MAQQPLNDVLKLRAPKALRIHLQRIADRRYLTVSDIAREALRDYVARQLATSGKKGEVVP